MQQPRKGPTNSQPTTEIKKTLLYITCYFCFSKKEKNRQAYNQSFSLVHRASRLDKTRYVTISKAGNDDWPLSEICVGQCLNFFFKSFSKASIISERILLSVSGPRLVLQIVRNSGKCSEKKQVYSNRTINSHITVHKRILSKYNCRESRLL